MSNLAEEVLTIFSDGASKGNPGQASIGASLCLAGEEIAFISEAIGFATNNVAEYTALKDALLKARDMEFENIAVKADSELMIKQLKGEYKVKNPDLKKIYLEIKSIEKAFKKISYQHVRREFNTRADELANLAL